VKSFLPSTKKRRRTTALVSHPDLCEENIMRRLTHLIVLAAFLFSCGGQWYLFQGIAWVKMIADNSQFVPFAEAVQMTFSGEYPCPICKAIAEKRAQTDKEQLVTLDKSQKKFLPSTFVSISAPLPRPFAYPSRRPDFFQARAEAPPTPPPRLALS
jgi:hypothetical protein